eukprot:7389442-Prymnesium_polylepis.1
MSTCSQGQQELMPDGTCGCPAQQELLAGQCRACPKGRHKPSAGNGLCTDEPLELWPLVLGGVMVFAFAASVLILQSHYEKQRVLSEKKLERDFLAVTCV